MPAPPPGRRRRAPGGRVDVRPEVIATGVDAPLTLLLRASGSPRIERGPGLTWGAHDRTVATVRAAEQVLDTVSRLTQSQHRLTEALIENQDRLTALRALIGVPIDSLDDDSALTMMLTEALELTDSSGAVLVRGDAVLTVGDPQSVSELRQRIRALSPPPAAPSSLEFSRGTAVVAALLSPDGDAALGLSRGPGRQYSTGDLQLVEAVVAATEKLMTLTRMHRIGVQQATIEREHQYASSLAQAILPTAPPVLAGLDVFAEVIPANLAGGDFIAFEVLDGVLWFAVGDVAGKGLPAAIVMTRAVSAARVAFHTAAENDPAGALAAVGEDLYDYLHAVGIFVTMVLGAHRPGSGVVHLCNAGHSPVISMVDRQTSWVPPSMPPVGVLRGVTGRNQSLPLDVGNVLVLGSDGLTEQEDPAGAMYGYDRFERKIVDLSALSLRNMGTRLIQDVTGFARGTAPSDDRTLVLFRSIG